MKQTKNNLLFNFIDLVFPKTCFSCRTRLEDGIICAKCQNELIFLQDICEFCGSRLQDSECLICRSEEFMFDKARSLFSFNTVVQSLIHELKYNEMTKVAEIFAEKAAEYLIRNQPFAKIDLIAPVPLHSVKKRHRGFNQSEILTRQLASYLQIEHLPSLIKRNRFTQTQTELGKADRKKNVSGAFNLNPAFDVTGKNILILDDVFTTGATLNAISELLKKHNSGCVYAFTIARA